MDQSFELYLIFLDVKRNDTFVPFKGSGRGPKIYFTKINLKKYWKIILNKMIKFFVIGKKVLHRYKTLLTHLHKSV